jgi:long-chain fatty acid transport protein
VKTNRSRVLYLVAALACMGVSAAHAGAFQLREQSASKLGNAFAGYTAYADDISIMWQNPAAMTMFNGSQALVSLSARAPKTQLKTSEVSSTFGFNSTGSRALENDIAENTLLPSIYVMYDPEDGSGFRFGLSANTPYGLDTKYDTAAISRYSALQSEITAQTVTATMAFKLNDHWSFGIGPQFQHFDMKLSRAINCGEIANADSAGVAGTNGGALDEDCYLENAGSNTNIGFVAGIHAMSERLKWGFSYRSRVVHDMPDGEVRVQRSSLITDTAFLAALNGQLQSQRMVTKMVIPENVNMGFAYDITPKFSVMADASWTRWSKLDSITFDYVSSILSQEKRTYIFNYNDSWFLSLGGDYRYDDNLTFRWGLARDWSPVPKEHRTVRMPDQDRVWYTTGLGYKYNDKFSLDLSYARIVTKDADVDVDEATSAGIPAFKGRFESTADIVGLQFNYKF